MTFEPPLLRPRRERRRPVRGLVVSGALLLAAIGVVAAIIPNTDRINDQFTVWQYTPSAAISGYADRTTMTDEGRFLFYASRPVIATGDAFDAVCATQEQGYGILGCYRPAAKTITLFDVTDARLDGLEDVVAAHEMLHAAWDRMSQAERDSLEPLLEAEAERLTNDPAFADTLEFYARAEPGERVNELHSIVGTEFAEISPELEAHYARYFSDRSVVVDLNTRSKAVFDEQNAAITSLVSQIDALAANIDGDYARYNSGYDTLNRDIADFNTRAATPGSFANEEEFAAEKNELLQRKASLDALYLSIDARRSQYNQLLDQLDDLNATAAELREAINITPRQPAS